MPRRQETIELGLNGASKHQVIPAFLAADITHFGNMSMSLNSGLRVSSFTVCRFGQTAAGSHRQLSQYPLQGESGRELSVSEEGHSQRNPHRPQVSTLPFVKAATVTTDPVGCFLAAHLLAW